MILKIALIMLAALIVLMGIAIGYTTIILNRLPKVKPDGIRIACVGDSITQGGGVLFQHMSRNSYPAFLQEVLGSSYQVINYGHTSRTLLTSGDYPYRKSPFFEASLKSDPSIVLIMLGTNDSKPQNWNALEYERQLGEFVHIYRNLPSHPAVYLMYPPKAFILEGKTEVAYQVSEVIIENEIIPIINRVGKLTGSPIIDIFSATRDHPEVFRDGVHPDAQGNKMIAKVVQEVLSK